MQKGDIENWAFDEDDNSAKDAIVDQAIGLLDDDSSST